MARRIGLLTGGGDCPGLNAVLWAAVKAAERHGIEVLGIEEGFEGLLRGGAVRLLRGPDVRNILGLGGTLLGSTNRGDPFRQVRLLDGVEVVDDHSDEVVAQIGRLGLDGIIAIGGDGTLAIAHELARRGARIIGVPKTIDNDLGATDHTFGFYTAVETAMAALDRLKTTGESHDRVMILEVMGRYAGWIALHSGMTGGAHIILVPEVPYRIEAVLARIRRRWDEERRNFTLIVVAEGAHPQGGATPLLDQGAGRRKPRVGGAGQQLADGLKRVFETGWDRPEVPEVRVTVLGHIQRGGSPCAYDRLISLRFGAEAVALAAAGHWNRMVCLRGTRIESVPLEAAVRGRHLVDPAGQLVGHSRAVGICLGDR